jgi:hypothetical protein
MNLYEQTRPLLQQLGQESFAKSKRKFAIQETNKYPVKIWGHASKQHTTNKINKPNEMRLLNPFKK